MRSDVNADIDPALIPLEARQAGTMQPSVVLAAIASLGQVTSNPPTQAEVQAISDKIDELLAALRATGSMVT